MACVKGGYIYRGVTQALIDVWSNVIKKCLYCLGACIDNALLSILYIYLFSKNDDNIKKMYKKQKRIEYFLYYSH